MLSVSIADAPNVTEGGMATFTVTLSHAPTSDVTVDYAAAAGTAALTDDFDITTGTLTFTPTGPLTQQITVQTVDDALNENDETFTVTLSNPANVVLAVGADQGQATINDNDPAPEVNVSHAGNVTEGQDAVFTVSLSAASGRVVTVRTEYDLHGRYGHRSGRLHRNYQPVADFQSGRNHQAGVRPNHRRFLVEGDETFFLSIVSGTNAFLGAQVDGLAAIYDPARLSIANVSMLEGSSGTTSFTFDVTLDTALGNDVTFDFSTVDDTATAGSDFTATSGSGTITAGSTSTTITVDVTGDTTVEADEQFFVDLSNVNAGGLDVSLASITEVGFLDTSGLAYGVQVIGSTAYVADGLSGLRVLDVSDPASITELGIFDTPGQAYGVQVIGSTAYVADGNSGLRVLDVNFTSRATGTIQNDDSATLSIGNVSMPEGSSGTTTFTFDVTLDAPVANDVTLILPRWPTPQPKAATSPQ
ncbi:MAG: Calx-beta domain-containing protein [Planctomycetaceae bacterium]